MNIRQINITLQKFFKHKDLILMKIANKFWVLVFIIFFFSTIKAESYNEDTTYTKIDLSILEEGKPLNNTDSTSVYKLGQNEFYSYQTPGYFDFAGNTFRTLYEMPAFSFRKETIWPWAAIIASTGVLYYYDKELLDGAQKLGKFLGIPGEDNRQKNIFIEALPINVPDDMGYALYFIGDGWTEIGINLGFYAYGLSTGDKRALTTASQLTEGLCAVGVVIQTLKRITGRQSPFTVDFDKDPKRGKWRPFPNQFTEYNKHVPQYDAFPSGHLATAMMSLTIISENYKEYNWIKPLGYTLMTLLGYQMLNNGVHWASDYPLALGIGYTIGKLAVLRGRRRAVAEKKGLANSSSDFFDKVVFAPLPVKNGLGLGLIYRF
jgi:hypothetical protein